MIHGIVCVGEGIFLGLKDLPFLAAVYTGFVLLIPRLMSRAANRATRLSLTSSKLAHKLDPSCIWSVFFSYNIARASLWSLRLSWIWFREMRELNALRQEERRILEDGEHWIEDDEHDIDFEEVEE